MDPDGSSLSAEGQISISQKKTDAQMRTESILCILFIRNLYFKE